MNDLMPQEKKLSSFLKEKELHAPGIVKFIAFFEQVGEILARSVEVLQPHIAWIASIDWKEAHRRLDEMPQKSKKAMVLASSKGWFFSWSEGLEDVLLLVEKLAEIELSEVDVVLAQYYRINLSSMCDRLAQQYPERAKAIMAAVKAHGNAGDDGYYLSVPVFIAQADGLLTELLGTTKSALGRIRGHTELQASERLKEILGADQRASDLCTALFSLHEQDFMKNSTGRSKIPGFSSLNRHQVMHGESSNYGTEINSLRAFSFLVHAGLHLPAVLESVLPMLNEMEGGGYVSR